MLLSFKIINDLCLIEEHNGNIDLDDDNAIEAIVWNDLQSETFN